MAQTTKKSLVEEVLDDALQVRETALANAKLALEEAFEPRIKSMISRQLQNEVEDEVEEEYEEEMEEEELEDPTNADDASIAEEEEEPSEMEEEEHGDEMEEGDYSDEVEEGDYSDEVEEGDYSDDEIEEEEEEDLDLEAVIAELEAELGEEEDEEEIEMDMDSEEEGEEELEMDMDSEEDEDEEIIDLEELLSALSEEEEEETVEEEEEEETELAAENSRLASELAEHREAVEILRSKLNEVNLLNAKLLYTTKLFRKYNLTNNQKMRVVESFDRTKSVRETKLVYSTLAESLGIGAQSKSTKRVSITEGFASKPTPSTKPKAEIISEGNDVAERFRRLVSYNK